MCEEGGLMERKGKVIHLPPRPAWSGEHMSAGPRLALINANSTWSAGSERPKKEEEEEEKGKAQRKKAAKFARQRHQVWEDKKRNGRRQELKSDFPMGASERPEINSQRGEEAAPSGTGKRYERRANRARPSVF